MGMGPGTGWFDRLRLRVARVDDGPLGCIADAQRVGGTLRVVERVGHDDCNGLAVEPDLIVLEDMEPLADLRIDEGLVRSIGQARGVAVTDDLDDSRHGPHWRFVQRCHPAEAGSRADDHGMELGVLVEVGRIACGARDLGPPVDACHRFPNRGDGHAVPPAISSARTIVRGSSSTL